MAAKYGVGDLVMYTAGAGGVANHNGAAAAVKFAVAAGNNGAPFFAENSRLIGNVITVSVAPFTYTVQFGPTGAVANDELQVLLIPEAQLKKITILNDVVVAGVGGSRRRRQSKKRRNQRNHNNNQ